MPISKFMGRSEGRVLLVMLLIAGGSWAFIEISDEVREGSVSALDQRILTALRSNESPHDPLGPKLLEQVARDLSALGSVSVLVLLTAAVSGFLLLTGNRRTAVVVVFAVITGFAAGRLLKAGFARPRPEFVPPDMVVSEHSFPSGHAMHAALTYLTLAALLTSLQSSRRVKAYILGAAISTMCLVGISRIYLGVHWPTAVLAGWTAGATWALIWWLIGRPKAIRLPMHHGT